MACVVDPPPGKIERLNDNAPPQPAPSPAGAMEDDRLSRIRAWAVENSPANQYKWIDPKTVIELVDELTRLRSAPPVTEEMVERALEAWFDSPPSETDMGLHRSMRAALTAALTPTSGTQP